LPAWIRQIAIEEEARQAERNAKPVTPEPMAAAAPAAEPAPIRRRLLPGEIDTARPAASPSTVRVERGAVESPSTPDVEAAPVSAIDKQPTPRAETARKLRLPGRDEITLRHALIGAVVIAVVVLLLLLLV
jgi:hypothetical protein